MHPIYSLIIGGSRSYSEVFVCACTFNNTRQLYCLFIFLQLQQLILSDCVLPLLKWPYLKMVLVSCRRDFWHWLNVLKIHLSYLGFHVLHFQILLQQMNYIRSNLNITLISLKCSPVGLKDSLHWEPISITALHWIFRSRLYDLRVALKSLQLQWQLFSLPSQQVQWIPVMTQS